MVKNNHYNTVSKILYLFKKYKIKLNNIEGTFIRLYIDNIEFLIPMYHKMRNQEFWLNYYPYKNSSIVEKTFLIDLNELLSKISKS
jgi:hypothetical protein